MKASDAAPDSKPPAWKPSGALSNPDPSIADMSSEEYKQCEGKSDFFRPAAKVPKMDGGHQCSLIERDHPEGISHQDLSPLKPDKMLPILSVSGCMFICKCRCVCVLLIVHV